MFDHIRNSNLIEGIDDSLQDARSMDAWDWLVTKKKVTPAVLLELHNGITIDQLSAKESGRFRTVNVTVGGRLCPAPHLAVELTYNWLADLREHWKTLDPKEMHIRFEKIHPFVDGNGRTGRMLMWWHEEKLGRKPTLISVEERQEYYKWFRDTPAGERTEQ